jgi:hypothetical protein
MRLYIAGKVTGDPDYKAKFDRADMWLKVAGYDVENPTEHGLENATWVGAMRWLIPRLLSCHGVALLPDWRKSRGARLEVVYR